MTLDSTFSLDPVCSASSSKERLNCGLRPSGKDQLASKDSLVYGPENDLLQGLIPSTDSNPPLAFPICIYGPSGSGKSELADWITNSFFGSYRILRLVASDFHRDYIDAVDLDNVAGFRKNICSTDQVVIFDNLEELARKPRAIEELEYLIANCERLIFTCARNPASIPEFPYRFVSRILGGLPVSLSHPASSTRRLILANELAKYGGSIQSDAAAWLAENSAMTIPAIQQVVSKLRIHFNFRKTINLKAVKNVFGETCLDLPSLNEIARKVAKHQRMRVSDIRSQSRKKSMVQARGITIFIARDVFQYKYEELGRFLGNRDHSTIMHAHRKFQQTISLDPELKKCIDDLVVLIRQNTVQQNAVQLSDAKPSPPDG